MGQLRRAKLVGSLTQRLVARHALTDVFNPIEAKQIVRLASVGRSAVAYLANKRVYGYMARPLLAVVAELDSIKDVVTRTIARFAMDKFAAAELCRAQVVATQTLATTM